MDATELQSKKDKAEELFSQGRFHDARNLYDSLKEYADKNPDIFVRLGDIATKLDDDFLAMDNYKKAAMAYSKCGAAIKAIAICKKIFSLHPSRTHLKDSLTALSAQLKTSRDRSELKEKRAVAQRKSLLGNPSSDTISSEPLIQISEDEFVDDDLLQPKEVHKQKEEPIKDGFDDFDEFIEDYIEIVEHVGEDSLSIDNANARERGLKRTPLFSDLSIDELMGVICQLNVSFVDMGDYVFRRGDEGQSIFIITSGAAEVISYTKYGEEVKYATLTDGDFFGEHEYFSGTTRRTEVRAVTDLELLEIKRNEMAALTARNPYMAKVLYDFYKERVLDKAMALSKVFKHMSIKDRKTMLETVQVESYPPGTDIVKFNDKGEHMFLVVSGTAEVWRLGSDGDKVTLSNLQENDYFGEVAMMLDRARTSNVTAVTTVDAILIGREHLDRVFTRYPIIKKVLEDVAMKHVKDNEVLNSVTEG